MIFGLPDIVTYMLNNHAGDYSSSSTKNIPTNRYRIKRILATEGNTPIAYDLVNYEIGVEQKIMNKLKTVPGVIEASEVNDKITKITSDNVRNLKDTIHHI